jgi:predicted Zn finger-like uncharacterized protein
MAIKVTCPSCGSVFKFGEEQAGKKVKCKNCQATIAVPADDEDEDRDDAAEERDDRPARKRSAPAKQGSNKTLFIILGVVGGLLLLCCGGSIVVSMILVNKASDAAKDFAKKLEEEMKKQQKVQMVVEEKVIGKLVLNQNDKINPNDPDIAIDRGNGIPEKKRAKTYNVQFSQGKTYVITMKQAPGSPLDPFLVLADPKGKSLASDDDSGGFLNARITHTAGMNGQYRIIATSFGNSAGDFILTVEER